MTDSEILYPHKVPYLKSALALFHVTPRLLSLLIESGKKCVKEGMKLKKGSTLSDEKASLPVGIENQH